MKEFLKKYGVYVVAGVLALVVGAWCLNNGLPGTDATTTSEVTAPATTPDEAKAESQPAIVTDEVVVTPQSENGQDDSSKNEVTTPSVTSSSDPTSN